MTGHKITTQEEHERHIEWTMWRQNSKITIKIWH